MAQDLHLAYFGKDANEWDLNMYPDRRRRITHWPSSKGKNNRRLNVDLIIPRQPVVRKRLGQVTQLAPSVHEHQVPTAPDTTEKPLLLEEMERLAASLSCIADGVTDEREQWMLKLKGTCSILEALSKHFRQYSHILLTPILTVESFIRWHVQQEPLANFSPLPPKEQDKSRLFIRQNSRAEDKGAIPEQVKEMEETIRNLKEQHYKELAGVSASLEGCVLEVRAQLEESEENVSTLKKTLRRVERRAHDLSHSEEVLKSEVQDLQQRLEELKIELDDAKHKRRKSNVPDWMNKRRSRAVSLAQWEENADDPLPRKVKRLNLSEEEMKKLITQFIEYRQNRQMERPIHEDYFLWMTRVMKGYTKTLQVACSISLACTDHEEDFMFSTFYDILTESTSAEVITASLEYSTKVLDTVMQIDHDCEAEAFHSEALKYLTTLTWLSTTEHDALIETLPHGKCVTTEGLKDLEEGILWSYTDKAKSFVTSIVTSLGALAKVEGDKHDLVSVVSVIKALAPNTTIKTIEEHIRSVVRITGRESTLSLSNLCSMMDVNLERHEGQKDVQAVRKKWRKKRIVRRRKKTSLQTDTGDKKEADESIQLYDNLGRPICSVCYDKEVAILGKARLVEGDELIACSVCKMLAHETCGGALEWDEVPLCVGCGRGQIGYDSDNSQAMQVGEGSITTCETDEASSGSLRDMLSEESEEDALGQSILRMCKKKIKEQPDDEDDIIATRSKRKRLGFSTRGKKPRVN